LKHTQACIQKNISVSWVAKLEAPPPPAPPTVTSEAQLRDDEIFRHRLQQVVIADAKRRSRYAENSQCCRPDSMAQIDLTPPKSTLIMHQNSAKFLRPIPQIPMDNTLVRNPEPPISRPSLGILPEEIMPSQSLPMEQKSLHGDLSISFLQDSMVAQPFCIHSSYSDLAACLEQHLQVPCRHSGPYRPLQQCCTLIRATELQETGLKYQNLVHGELSDPDIMSVTLFHRDTRSDSRQ